MTPAKAAVGRKKPRVPREGRGRTQATNTHGNAVTKSLGSPAREGAGRPELQIRRRSDTEGPRSKSLGFPAEGAGEPKLQKFGPSKFKKTSGLPA